MLVRFKSPVVIHGKIVDHIQTMDVTLIPVDNIQCIQMIIEGQKWQPVLPLKNVLNFSYN